MMDSIFDRSGERGAGVLCCFIARDILQTLYPVLLELLLAGRPADLTVFLLNNSCKWNICLLPWPVLSDGLEHGRSLAESYQLAKYLSTVVDHRVLTVGFLLSVFTIITALVSIDTTKKINRWKGNLPLDAPTILMGSNPFGADHIDLYGLGWNS